MLTVGSDTKVFKDQLLRRLMRQRLGEVVALAQFATEVAQPGHTLMVPSRQTGHTPRRFRPDNRSLQPCFERGLWGHRSWLTGRIPRLPRLASSFTSCPPSRPRRTWNVAPGDEMSYAIRRKVAGVDPPLADRDDRVGVVGYLTPMYVTLMYGLESWQRFGPRVLRREDGAR
jgi:hypothetical protein